MAPIGSAPAQLVMIGLVTGAEVFGALPRAAAGRVADYMNSELAEVLTISQASTEDVEAGAEVGELSLALRQVTYVQPWGTAEVLLSEIPVTALPRFTGTAVETELVLRTRISVSGTILLPAGIDLVGMLTRADERFVRLVSARLRTPNGEIRETDGVLVNREQIMLFRRITHKELTRPG